MKKIIWAPAKINLTLEVIGKRNDGYHLLRTVMLKMNRLQDKLTLEVNLAQKTKITLFSKQKDLPLNEKNTCYKATNLFLEAIGKTAEIKLLIEKNIPSGAGLGGGSSDAGKLLSTLNQLFGFSLSDSKLIKIASMVGKDVPFFLFPEEVALMVGLGDCLEKKIKVKGNFFVLLIKPVESVSTAMAYGGLADNLWFLKNKKRVNWSLKIEKIFKSNSLGIAEKVTAGLYNDFEVSIERQLPIIKELKQSLLAFGAHGALMSGSGSTVFGIFSSLKKMMEAQRVLAKKYPHFFIARGR